MAAKISTCTSIITSIIHFNNFLLSASISAAEGLVAGSESVKNAKATSEKDKREDLKGGGSQKNHKKHKKHKSKKKKKRNREKEKEISFDSERGAKHKRR